MKQQKHHNKYQPPEMEVYHIDRVLMLDPSLTATQNGPSGAGSNGTVDNDGFSEGVVHQPSTTPPAKELFPMEKQFSPWEDILENE